MPLTDVIVKKAAPRPTSYKLPDERGLYLLVMPNGRKYWRMRYSWKGKENPLAFGVYPDVSLKMARVKRDEARLVLAQGLNPKNAEPDSSIVFFSHSHAENGGFYGYGELLGKSGPISDAYRQKK